MKKNRLPVDLRCSKTPLHKLSNSREDKSLRHVAIVAKFQQTVVLQIWRKTEALKCMIFLCLNALKNKTVRIPYYSSIFRLGKCPSLSRKIVEIQKFCYHGNVTLHFSTPYLPLVIPVQWLLGFTWFDATDIMRSAGHYLVNQGGGLGLNDKKVLTSINK